MDSVYALNNSLWFDIEKALTPLSKNSDQWTIIHILPLTYLIPTVAATSFIATVCSIASYAISFFIAEAPVDPHKDFSAVCKDPRNWEKLDTIENQITLGQNDPEFLRGIATCTYQDSGSTHCPDSQWVQWENQVLPRGNRSGSSANLFELYKTQEGRNEVIDRLRKLGVNSFRFSVEWSQIEPREGKFNEANMQVYIDLCKALRDAEITPMVTLHHFSEPAWFHTKGSFENESNIDNFVRFSEHTYKSLTVDYNDKSLVDLFCTINEPAIEAFSRYVRGAFSPGYMFQFERAGNFLKGALKAHTAVYETLKKLPTTTPTRIGFSHQCLRFTTTITPLYPVACYLTRLIHDVVLQYLKTGFFELKIPLFCNVSEQLEKPPVDFIGAQYYTRVPIDIHSKPSTMMPFPEDPEGIYEALVELSKACDCEIMVTEFGISTHDDKQRARHLLRSLYAIQRAREVIGEKRLNAIYAWCFGDNLEWNMGMNPQSFGAFPLITKADGTQILGKEPKAGMAPFIKVAQKNSPAQLAHNVA